MSTTEVVVVDAEKDATRRDDMVSEIESIVFVKTQEQFDEATRVGTVAAALIKEIEEHHEETISLTNKAHKAAIAMRNKVVKPIKDALEPLALETGRWIREKKAADLKGKRRLEDEERRKAEDRKLAQAEALAEAGHEKAADAVIDTPVVVPKVKMPDRPTTSSGEKVGSRENWTYVVEDPELIPREWLMEDKVKIGAEVRKSKDKTDIPGIRAYSDTKVVFG